MSHDNHTFDINPALTKDDIKQIVSSEPMQQAIKDSHDAWEKTKFKWQIFVALIMAFSAAFGYYLKWDSDRKDRIEQQIQAANERKVEQIQTVINQKMEWMLKLDNAVMDMRQIHESIVMKCQYHQPRDVYLEKISRIKAEFNVARAADGIRFIFDNNVQNKSRELTKFDESVSDVCAINSPPDDAWKNYLVELNDIMGTSIADDINQINKLK